MLAIPRNIDRKPIGGLDAFATAYGLVPNDGAWHTLVEPVTSGVPPFRLAITDRLRINFVRAEWSTVDVVVPPPLTLRLIVEGQLSVAFTMLQNVPLFPLAIGTAAVELRTYAEIAPGFKRIIPQVRNTGTVDQRVDVQLSGWSYPQTFVDGRVYAPSGATA